MKYRLTGNNEVSIAGVTLDLSPDRISSRMVSTIRTSMYESREARLLRSHLHEGLPLIDLGAGIGFLSCLGAELGADSMGSVAVEADASLIPIIEHTRALNDADFTIVNRAYHPGEDEIDVHIRSDFWSSSSFRRAVSADRKVTVATADLSGIIDDFGVTRP